MELNFWIKSNSIIDLSKASFDLTDDFLVKPAGSCISCPKRTCEQSALFEEYSNENKCLDPACYDSKVKAHIAIIVDNLKAKGKEPILISDALYGKPKNAVGSLHYEIKTAKDKCKNCQLAVIIHSDKGSEGRQVHVCMTETCTQQGDTHTQEPFEQSADILHSRMVIELTRHELIHNVPIEARHHNFMKCWCMFFNLENKYKQYVVDELSWSIEEEEGVKLSQVREDNAELFFFENFKGSKVDIEEIEHAYVMEMIIAVDEMGKTGYDIQDEYVNENITSVTVGLEKRFKKTADKLMKLKTDPEKKFLKGLEVNDLLIAYKQTSDLILLAEKLGMSIDLKTDPSREQIAKLIIEKYA